MKTARAQGERKDERDVIACPHAMHVHSAGPSRAWLDIRGQSPARRVRLQLVLEGLRARLAAVGMSVGSHTSRVTQVHAAWDTLVHHVSNPAHMAYEYTCSRRLKVLTGERLKNKLRKNGKSNLNDWTANFLEITE
eukprot:1540265-Pyramimonas_sp.AAC.1